MNLSKLGEFGLIRKFLHPVTPSRKVIVGIGDDTAAVLPFRKNNLMLLTCDPVIEGIHFNSLAKPYQIGWKALARNLSDIAAMGGIPRYALVAASFPRKMQVSKVMKIHRGLVAAAQRYGVEIIGGDTSCNPQGIHLVVTIIGEVSRKELIRRSGACPGDVLCVTGTLGGSIWGKHLSFYPRVQEARFLAQSFRPSSMMDLSDGLASDLQRLAEQSKVGFEVWAHMLPISAALRARKFSKYQEIQHAMQDGEDYELVFTMAPKHFQKLQIIWKKRFRLRLTQIGIVHPFNFGIKLIGNMKTRAALPLPRMANDHFRQ